MAACDAQTLVNQTPALNGIPQGLLPYIEVSLLCQILQASNGMAACDSQSLVTAAACLACQIPPGLVPFVEVYLLCQIQAGGGGGGSALLSGAGSPAGIVAGVSGQRYYNTTNGSFFTNTDGTVNGWRAG